MDYLESQGLDVSSNGICIEARTLRDRIREVGTGHAWLTRLAKLAQGIHFTLSEILPCLWVYWSRTGFNVLSCKFAPTTSLPDSRFCIDHSASAVLYITEARPHNRCPARCVKDFRPLLYRACSALQQGFDLWEAC